MNATFLEITAILALAAGLGLVAIVLRQPLIVAFLVVGIVSGAGGLGIVQAHEYVAVSSFTMMIVLEK